MPSHPHPIEKHGGMRKAVKHRPKLPPPSDYFKEISRGIFPKKLSQYRFIIFTDLEPDDMAFLMLFTAWVKANEPTFDSHSTFPIYAMVIGGGKAKAQRAHEFLTFFANTFAWNDPDHQLYDGLTSAQERIWFDGDPETSFENEIKLVRNKEIVALPDYPVPELFSIGIDELKVKPGNLFAVYLKQPKFLDSLDSEAVAFLKKIPGVLCSGDSGLKSFIHRGPDDAPLVYIDKAECEKIRITAGNCPAFFKELDDEEDWAIGNLLLQSIYIKNEEMAAKYTTELGNVPEFTDCDFDDVETLQSLSKKMPTYADKLSHLEADIVHNSQHMYSFKQLAMVAMLIGNKTIEPGKAFSVEPMEKSKLFIFKTGETAETKLQKILTSASKLI